MRQLKTIVDIQRLVVSIAETSMKISSHILSVGLALLISSPVVSAAVMAVTFDPNSESNAANNNTIGWRFGVSADISVTALGVLNGVLTTGNAQAGKMHEVGIYSEETQELLASAFVANGIAGSTEQWEWTSLSTPLVLAAGSIYRIATYANGDNWIINSTNYAAGAEILVGTALAPGVPVSDDPGSRVAAYAAGNNQLQYPSNISVWTVNDISDGIFGANFRYEVIPEPSSIVLLALGLAGVLGMARANFGKTRATVA